MCDDCDARFALNPLGATKVTLEIADGQVETYHAAGGVIFACVTETAGHAPSSAAGDAPTSVNAGVIGSVASALYLIAHLVNTLQRDMHVPLEEALVRIYEDAKAMERHEASGMMERELKDAADITSGTRQPITHVERADHPVVNGAMIDA